MFAFRDRLGDLDILDYMPDETAASVLWRNDIPPQSVVVTDAQGQPVRDDKPLEEDSRYTATLIEGYDIRAVQKALKGPSTCVEHACYTKRRTVLDAKGGVDPQLQEMDLQSIAAYVEETVAQTLTEFMPQRQLRRLLVGLSGGVDSSTLLYALDAVRQNGLLDFDLVAVTFEDFDSATSPSFERAKRTCAKLDIEHHVLPASLAEETFNLNAPLKHILPELMSSRWRASVMYVDHHTTRRCLEVAASELGIDDICLGLHATDVLGGLLNSYVTGHRTGTVPIRCVGPYWYWYPLSYVTKKEAHLYFLHKTGRLADHTYPNPWERFPLDRNLYYYLADMLQSIWPGSEVHFIEGHLREAARSPCLSFSICENCGGAVVSGLKSSPRCDVCELLDGAGFLE
jgi:hypothetical protein